MTHDKYDTDILKTLKSIDVSLKSIAKSVQPTSITGNPTCKHSHITSITRIWLLMKYLS